MSANMTGTEKFIVGLCEKGLLSYTGSRRSKHLVFSRDNFELTPSGKLFIAKICTVIGVAVLGISLIAILGLSLGEDTVELGGTTVETPKSAAPKMQEPTDNVANEVQDTKAVDVATNTEGVNYASADDVFINPNSIVGPETVQNLIGSIKSMDFRLECRDYDGRLYREYRGTLVRSTTSDNSHVVFDIGNYETTLGTTPSKKEQISADLNNILVDYNGRVDKIAGGFQKSGLTIIAPDNKCITEMYCTRTDFDNKVVYLSYITNIQY